MSFTQNLTELYERDLNRLKAEIEAYSYESMLWLTSENIKNSAGNLCLHITGNLQHFIGTVLGGSGYVRDRDLEFSAINLSPQQLLQSVDDTIAMLKRVLPRLREEDIDKPYPLDLKMIKEGMNTGYFLIHLHGHLNYHLGQINYHRRLLDIGEPV